MHELRYYLRTLLDHQCEGQACPDCRRLDRIYALIAAELFATVVYADTPVRKPLRRRRMAPLIDVEALRDLG
jgi:hypothetical protein